MRLSQAVFTIVVVALAAGVVGGAPRPVDTWMSHGTPIKSTPCPDGALCSLSTTWGGPSLYCGTSGSVPCSDLYRAPPAPITLKTPITITVTTGDVTLEGGALTLGPDGKTYEGGTVTVHGGSVVLDPRR